MAANDLYMEIYGRPAAQWELDQTMGMPEDQLRAVLEASIADWRSQQAAQPPAAAQSNQPEFVITNAPEGVQQNSSGLIPDNISDGVLGFLGFKSRDEYRQAMADSAAQRAADTSGFVTGGGAPAPATTASQFQPQFATGPSNNPVQQITGNFAGVQSLGGSGNGSSGYSATPQMVGATGSGPEAAGGFYQSNLIKSLRDASATDNPQAASGVSFMPNQANTASGNAGFGSQANQGLIFNPKPTTLDAYDPTPIFQEIYGRNPTSSELEYAKSKRPADLRTTLEQSLAEWQAKQNPQQQQTTPQTPNYNFSDA